MEQIFYCVTSFSNTFSRVVIRVLRGAIFFTPPRIYPLSQIQIHPYPEIFGENYPFPPVPASKFNSLNISHLCTYHEYNKDHNY